MGLEPILRSMDQNDLDSILDVEHSCFSIPWTRGMFEDELYNPNAIYLVALVNDTIVGYAGMWKILDEGHITNVAVHPDYRRNGLGKRLIQGLILKSKILGLKALTLEVRRSNEPAISLYEGFGFRVEGLRKKYYSDNNEDALIMWLKL